MRIFKLFALGSAFCLTTSVLWAQAPEIKQTTVAIPENSVQVSEKPNSIAEPNALSFEFGGRAVLYSLNYDRTLGTGVGFGVGATYFSATVANVDANLLIVPLYTNLYVLPHRHRPFVTAGLDVVSVQAKIKSFEAGVNSDGIGRNSFFIKDLDLINATFSLPLAGAGYEFRGSNGILARVAAYATYLDRVYPWAGVTLGAAF